MSALRVVVTRAAHQAEELARPLRERGFEVLLVPVIGIAKPSDERPLQEALAQIERYDWIVFTSTNTIRAIGPQPCRARVATVGAATRDYAEQNGWTVSVTPEQYVAEGLIAALGKEDLRGRKILIPSAAVTRDVVRDELTKLGATVDVVEAYRNVMPDEAREQSAKVFQAPYPDWVTFASSSAVENLVKLVGGDILLKRKIASIGPITTKTLREHGLTVTAEAEPHTVLGLAAAIA